LVAPRIVVDGDIVVTVESTSADTVIAMRYRSDNGYLLVRTYQLAENERKETSASREALTTFIKKKRLITTEDIKKALLGAAGISSD
jgi:hypothetical protein